MTLFLYGMLRERPPMPREKLLGHHQLASARSVKLPGDSNGIQPDNEYFPAAIGTLQSADANVDLHTCTMLLAPGRLSRTAGGRSINYLK